jgi:hypothetical protein
MSTPAISRHRQAATGVPKTMRKGLHYVGSTRVDVILATQKEDAGQRDLRHIFIIPQIFKGYSFGTQDSIDAGVTGDAFGLELFHQGTDLLQV